ncbi:MAG: hypothetical protein MZW92_76045 [Comamonadaceae bacterium]|nr:hypothetical protein [Comamonadaceae bacterium]
MITSLNPGADEAAGPGGRRPPWTSLLPQVLQRAGCARRARDGATARAGRAPGAAHRARQGAERTVLRTDGQRDRDRRRCALHRNAARHDRTQAGGSAAAARAGHCPGDAGIDRQRRDHHRRGRQRAVHERRWPATLTGWPLSDAKGQPVSLVYQLRDENTGQALPNPVREVLHRRPVPCPRRGHAVLRQRDGGSVPVHDTAAPIRNARRPYPDRCRAGVPRRHRDARTWRDS